MDNVNYVLQNGTMEISLSGHVDSGNAAAIESEMEKICQENAFDAIVVDAENLTYISSAGLRILLRLKKKFDSLRLVNVSSEVYEVFEMTGFTEIMKIEKAYRKISVDGCEVIGQGSNGKVYRLDPDTIVKVYKNPDSLAEIQHERDVARKAFVLGIPTAIPYDVVKVGDNFGSVFELLNAKSFSKLIMAEPQNISKYVKLSVDLLKKIHSTVVADGDLPKMNAVALRWADDLKGQLPENEWQKLRKLISEIPDDNHMLHGDYHTKNLMMQDGEVLLIDMDTLAVGNPVFEFAFIFNAYVGFEEDLPKEEIGQFLGLDYDKVHAIWDETLKLYFGTDDKEFLREKSEKCQVLSYTRILRRTIHRLADTDEGKKLIAKCKSKLAYLLPHVDSLAF